MAIARSHVELMGGRLLLESGRGAGASFSFTLPLEAAPSDGAGDGGERWSRVQRLAAGHTVHALVVDGPTDGDICRRFLTGIGVEVELVHGSCDARDRARQRQPDIVLMDNRLPDHDGAPARRVLVDACGEDAFPIICTTTAVLAHERQALQEEGYEHFLDKPVRADELYASLSALLNVEYEYGEAAEDGDQELRGLEWDSLSVTAELASQLEGAAERQSLSELKQHIDTLAALGSSEARLASHLQQLSRRFDMAAVKDLVRRL